MPPSFRLSFAERRKPRATPDELALTKAAAWAWYQRGSGSEASPECHLTRSHRPHFPSRFKLEAMKEAGQVMPVSNSDSSSRVSSPCYSHVDDNSLLLDTYEIETISRQLDYYKGAGDRGHRREVSLPEDSGPKNDTTNVKKKGKMRKGLWLRYGVVCGSRDDVVELATVSQDKRLLENHKRTQMPSMHGAGKACIVQGREI
ncbi:hypothetical protein NMG60_11026533 [Bertholletia excelsa]